MAQEESFEEDSYQESPKSLQVEMLPMRPRSCYVQKLEVRGESGAIQWSISVFYRWTGI